MRCVMVVVDAPPQERPERMIRDASGACPTSVRAMKAGALEFLTKPFHDQDLLDAIAKAIERHRLTRRRRAELDALNGLYGSLRPAERKSWRSWSQGC